MIDIEKLWLNITYIFPILDGKLEHHTINDNLLNSVRNQLIEINSFESFGNILWDELCRVIHNNIVPKFWQYFDIEEISWSEEDQQSNILELRYKLFQRFVDAVKGLYTDYNILVKTLKRLQLLKENDMLKLHEAIEKMHEVLREGLLGQLPVHFSLVVHAFYYVSFNVFGRKMEMSCDANIIESNVFNCSGCNLETVSCNCECLSFIIKEVNEILLNLTLLDRLAGQIMTIMVQKRIEKHISYTCQGIYDQSQLKKLETWLNDVIITWLTLTFNNESLETRESSVKTKNIIESSKIKLTYFLYENYAHSIMEQFFNIIIDFPDSIPAIDDLKICMEKIDLKRCLIKILKSSLEARILHPGVNTMDILTGYIAAIKAIRYLDSSGVVLETVTTPIKEYLRKRSDTVRRVVTGLTEEGPTDLSEELAKGETFNDNMICGINDELSNWEDWMPDPFGVNIANRNQNAKRNRSSDIISMVVDIYGSKELFVNEYRNLMADRLLNQLDFNPEREIRNLELLKLRFGESLLHNCEVMLKDVTDSKRINIHIQSDTKYVESRLFEISTLIISAQFWPPFNRESIELPEEIAKEFSKYTTSYEAYKGNRTLNWRCVTGRVNIVLELSERTIEMTVPPTQAVIIYHFQKKNEWTLDELSAQTKIPPVVLRRRIVFWQSHGIVSEDHPGVFKLIEKEIQSNQLQDIHNNHLIVDFDDIESAMASASDQREEELQVFWSYIVGMLTNLDTLPIERIHQMLKLFASHGLGVEFSQDELRDFLQRKVREHKLIFSGGVYQLAK